MHNLQIHGKGHRESFLHHLLQQRNTFQAGWFLLIEVIIFQAHLLPTSGNRASSDIMLLFTPEFPPAGRLSTGILPLFGIMNL